MSRSVNHQRYHNANNRPYAQRGHRHGRDDETLVWFCDECNLPGDVWFSHEERTVRRRPGGRVDVVTRTFVARQFTSMFSRSSARHFARDEEHASRARWRAWARSATKAANGAGDAFDDVVESFDPPTPRYRHSALWDAS